MGVQIVWFLLFISCKACRHVLTQKQHRSRVFLSQPQYFLPSTDSLVKLLNYHLFKSPDTKFSYPTTPLPPFWRASTGATGFWFWVPFFNVFRSVGVLSLIWGWKQSRSIVADWPNCWKAQLDFVLLI